MRKPDLKPIKEANYSCKQFLEYLQEKYDFTKEENENIKNMKDHLINLNVIFSKVKK